ncbi:MAG: hypothetical protein FJ316_07365 [SAR202 cluster bacterium]|nr:hypothetical protein [SAR202 cluster bacterium]
MQFGRIWQQLLTGAAALATLAAAACGTAATPTTQPTATARPANTPPAATAPAAPTAVPKPTAITSARNSITLVLNEEPITLDPFLTQGGIAQSAVKDNMVDALTWQSFDDLRVVPTGATESWKQMDPDTWQFELRKGVKFHNGEAWNAQAALPSLAFQGVAANGNTSYRLTGGYKAEAVGEYTVNINCDLACPILPSGSTILNFTAPNYLASATKEDLTRNVVSFGPYKLIKWEAGVSITGEVYDGYTPGGNHKEFQKPYIRNAKWFWRNEPTVATAMVKAGEADIAWDVGVEATKALPKEMIRSGSSAEVFQFHVNTLWHPELKKKKVRLAIVHAINCKEIVETLYGGLPPCRGNFAWPGVTGATQSNTAPYEYNPTLSKQLLQEAGYDPKNKIRIMGRANRIPKLPEVYEAMQAYLKNVGITAEIGVVEPAQWRKLRECGAGQALIEVLQAQGKDPAKDKPTLADMQAALDKGGATCPQADTMENQLSLENLDYGTPANNYLNCTRPLSFICDPSPGGLQEQLAAAQAASGVERQRLMAALADRVHDDALVIPMFEPPVVYAVHSKLNWKPRFDRRVRVSTMWFSP